MLVLPYLDYTPSIGAPELAHETSALIGRVKVGAGCQFGRLATLRADGERVEAGPGCWFDEASTLHIADSAYPAVVGANVTLGRFALVHACTVEDDCVIGEGAVVMDGAHVGRGAVLAAHSLVPPGKRLEGGWLYSGLPAKPVEKISDAARARLGFAIRTRGEFAPGQSERPESIWATQPIVSAAMQPGVGIEAFRGSLAYVAPTASVAGRVRLARDSSVWFGVCLDAGAARIDIGEGSNIQDNTWIAAGAMGEDVRIGARVTVGHNVRIQSCLVEDGAMIGMGSIIAPGTVVREGGCVAAGAITEPGTEVPAGQVYSGRPARKWRPVSDKDRQDFSRAVDVYIGYAKNYLAYEAQAREETK